MSSPLSFDSKSSSQGAASALIRHFDPRAKAAYLRLEQSQALEYTDIVIDAIVIDHMPNRDEAPVDLANEDLNLITDLEFDSVAIAEMVFFIEDLFLVKISNEEILSLSTIGDLRKFVREKLASLPKPTG